MASAMSSSSYHHGDLRAALLAATVELLRRDGLDAVTLRSVARRAGVSEAAPYHHFPSKTHLLLAAAAQGFAALDARMRGAVAAAGAAVYARIVAAGCAYVEFALDEPGYFRLLFGAHVVELAAHADAAEVKKAGQSASGLLRGLVAELVDGGKVRLDAQKLERIFWAQIHGVAWLVVEKELRPEPSRAQAIALARDGIELVLDGAGAKAPRGYGRAALALIAADTKAARPGRTRS
jgi:AcrR family transcriptional regulator